MRQSPTSSDTRASIDSNTGRPLRDRKALWVEDRYAIVCAGCTARFTFYRRRHHCRQCGQIFCGDCLQVVKVAPANDPRRNVVPQKGGSGVLGLLGFGQDEKVCHNCAKSRTERDKQGGIRGPLRRDTTFQAAPPPSIPRSPAPPTADMTKTTTAGAAAPLSTHESVNMSPRTAAMVDEMDLPLPLNLAQGAIAARRNSLSHGDQSMLYTSGGSGRWVVQDTSAPTGTTGKVAVTSYCSTERDPQRAVIPLHTHHESIKERSITYGPTEIPLVCENEFAEWLRGLLDQARITPKVSKAILPTRRRPVYRPVPFRFRTGERVPEAGLFATAFLDTDSEFDARSGLLEVLQQLCVKHLDARMRCFIRETNFLNEQQQKKESPPGGGGTAAAAAPPLVALGTWHRLICDIAWRVISQTVCQRKPNILDHVDVLVHPGGTLEETEIIPGVAFLHTVDRKHMRTRIDNPRILLLGGDVGVTVPSVPTKVVLPFGASIGSSLAPAASPSAATVSSSMVTTTVMVPAVDLFDYSSMYPGLLDKLYERIQMLNPTLIIVEKGMHHYLRDRLSKDMKDTVTLLTDVGRTILRRIEVNCNTTIIDNLQSVAIQDLYNERYKPLGSCSSFQISFLRQEGFFDPSSTNGPLSGGDLSDQIKLGSSDVTPVVMLTGLARSTYTTVLLRGKEQTVGELEAVKDLLQQAFLSAYHLALQTHYLVDFYAVIPQRTASVERDSSSIADLPDSAISDEQQQSSSPSRQETTTAAVLPDVEEVCSDDDHESSHQPVAIPALKQQHSDTVHGGSVVACESLTMNLGVGFSNEVLQGTDMLLRLQNQLRASDETTNSALTTKSFVKLSDSAAVVTRDNILVNVIFLEGPNGGFTTTIADQSGTAVVVSSSEAAPAKAPDTAASSGGNKADGTTSGGSGIGPNAGGGGPNAGSSSGTGGTSQSGTASSATAAADVLRTERHVYQFYSDETLWQFLCDRVNDGRDSLRHVVHGDRRLIIRSTFQFSEFYGSVTSPKSRSGMGSVLQQNKEALLGTAATPRTQTASNAQLAQSLSELYFNVHQGASNNPRALVRVPMCYTICKKCQQSKTHAATATSGMSFVSPHTLNLSFGAFLELSTYMLGECIAMCGHTLHRDITRCFVLYPTEGTQVTISFDTEHLPVFTIKGPQPSMRRVQRFTSSLPPLAQLLLDTPSSVLANSLFVGPPNGTASADSRSPADAPLESRSLTTPPYAGAPALLLQPESATTDAQSATAVATTTVPNESWSQTWCWSSKQIRCTTAVDYHFLDELQEILAILGTYRRLKLQRMPQTAAGAQPSAGASSAGAQRKGRSAASPLILDAQPVYSFPTEGQSSSFPANDSSATAAPSTENGSGAPPTATSGGESTSDTSANVFKSVSPAVAELEPPAAADPLSHNAEGGSDLMQAEPSFVPDLIVDHGSGCAPTSSSPANNNVEDAESSFLNSFETVLVELSQITTMEEALRFRLETLHPLINQFIDECTTVEPKPVHARSISRSVGGTSRRDTTSIGSVVGAQLAAVQSATLGSPAGAPNATNGAAAVGGVAPPGDKFRSLTAEDVKGLRTMHWAYSTAANVTMRLNEPTSIVAAALDALHRRLLSNEDPEQIASQQQPPPPPAPSQQSSAAVHRRTNSRTYSLFGPRESQLPLLPTTTSSSSSRPQKGPLAHAQTSPQFVEDDDAEEAGLKGEGVSPHRYVRVAGPCNSPSLLSPRSPRTVRFNLAKDDAALHPPSSSGEDHRGPTSVAQGVEANHHHHHHHEFELHDPDSDLDEGTSHQLFSQHEGEGEVQKSHSTHTGGDAVPNHPADSLFAADEIVFQSSGAEATTIEDIVRVLGNSDEHGLGIDQPAENSLTAPTLPLATQTMSFLRTTRGPQGNDPFARGGGMDGAGSPHLVSSASYRRPVSKWSRSNRSGSFIISTAAPSQQGANNSQSQHHQHHTPYVFGATNAISFNSDDAVPVDSPRNVSSSQHNKNLLFVRGATSPSHTPSRTPTNQNHSGRVAVSPPSPVPHPPPRESEDTGSLAASMSVAEEELPQEPPSPKWTFRVPHNNMSDPTPHIPRDENDGFPSFEPQQLSPSLGPTAVEPTNDPQNLLANVAAQQPSDELDEPVQAAAPPRQLMYHTDDIFVNDDAAIDVLAGLSDATRGLPSSVKYQFTDLQTAETTASSSSALRTSSREHVTVEVMFPYQFAAMRYLYGRCFSVDADDEEVQAMQQEVDASPQQEGGLYPDSHHHHPLSIASPDGMSKHGEPAVVPRNDANAMFVDDPETLQLIEHQICASLQRCRPFQTQGGKTKSDFFKTIDGRFLLKQIKLTELKHFYQLGPTYFSSMVKVFVAPLDELDSQHRTRGESGSSAEDDTEEGEAAVDGDDQWIDETSEDAAAVSKEPTSSTDLPSPSAPPQRLLSRTMKPASGHGRLPSRVKQSAKQMQQAQKYNGRRIRKERRAVTFEELTRCAANCVSPSDAQTLRTPPTALAKIFGVFSIQSKRRRMSLANDIKYWMLMENLSYNRRADISYDLKGSQVNRVAAEGSSVQLDQDFVRRTKQGYFLFLREPVRSWLLNSLQNDVNLLSSAGIMDYSLMVGVDEQTERLSLGIIDYLHPYTSAKALESTAKKQVQNLLGQGLDPTIVDPVQYRQRFLKWMELYFCPVPNKLSSLRRQLLANKNQVKNK